MGGRRYKYPLFVFLALLAAGLFAAGLLVVRSSPEAGGSQGLATLQEDEPVAYEQTQQAATPEATAAEATDNESQPPPEENVYAAAMTTEVREDLAGIPERVYVPNVIDGTVSVIDPKTFEIVDSYAVGELPYHVTPAWDMKR